MHRLQISSAFYGRSRSARGSVIRESLATGGGRYRFIDSEIQRERYAKRDPTQSPDPINLAQGTTTTQPRATCQRHQMAERQQAEGRRQKGKGSELTLFLLHFSNAYFRTINSTLPSFSTLLDPLNASLYLSKLIFIIAAVASFYEHHQKLIKTQCVLYLQAVVVGRRQSSIPKWKSKSEPYAATPPPLEPGIPEPETQHNRGAGRNHKGNMLHMHSPKAICIQMLPTHFTKLHNHSDGEGVCVYTVRKGSENSS